MTLQEAIKILKSHNKWRRRTGSDGVKMCHPTDLGLAIDLIVENYEAKNAPID